MEYGPSSPTISALFEPLELAELLQVNTMLSKAVVRSVVSMQPSNEQRAAMRERSVNLRENAVRANTIVYL